MVKTTFADRKLSGALLEKNNHSKFREAHQRAKLDLLHEMQALNDAGLLTDERWLAAAERFTAIGRMYQGVAE
jgi:hypothetical protein